MTQLTEDRVFAQNYFSFLSNQSNESSGPVVVFSSRYDIPEPAAQKELVAAHRAATKHHEPVLQKLKSIQLETLSELSLYLRYNFNILCYGYGSKESLIEEVGSNLEDFDQASLKGFNETCLNIGPVATMNNFLVTVAKTLFDYDLSTSTRANLQEKAELLISLAESRKNRILLIIHQLDSPCFRSDVIQQVFSILAASSNVSLIASIDNPNISNLWPRDRFDRFNWLWTDLTTMQPYDSELAQITKSLAKSSSNKRSPATAVIVLQSLTPNCRSIFKLLATHQLNLPEGDIAVLLEALDSETPLEEAIANIATTNSSNNQTIGISFHALFQKCQENFVASAEANFRTQLTEFLDHDLFKAYEGWDGSVLYFIPFTHDEIRQVLQEL